MLYKIKSELLDSGIEGLCIYKKGIEWWFQSFQMIHTIIILKNMPFW